MSPARVERTRLSLIRLICLDVDGVLTNGRILVDDDGRPTRAFHIHDGLAIRWFQKLGGVCAIITGKFSHGVAHRARELGIEHVIQNSDNKLKDMTALAEKLGLRPDEIAAVGDDLPDLPMLRNCGFPVAVANASPEAKTAARYVTRRPGGSGAVREAIEVILHRDGRWPQVIAHYEAQASGAAPAQTFADPASAGGGDDA